MRSGAAGGLTPDRSFDVRGFEHPDDILDDLSQALDAAEGASVNEPTRKAA
jgi:hypothetical protein